MHQTIRNKTRKSILFIRVSIFDFNSVAISSYFNTTSCSYETLNRLNRINLKLKSLCLLVRIYSFEFLVVSKVLSNGIRYTHIYICITVIQRDISINVRHIFPLCMIYK